MTYLTKEQSQKILAIVDALIYTAISNTNFENVYNDQTDESFSWLEVRRARDTLKTLTNGKEELKTLTNGKEELKTFVVWNPKNPYSSEPLGNYATLLLREAIEDCAFSSTVNVPDTQQIEQLIQAVHAETDVKLLYKEL